MPFRPHFLVRSRSISLGLTPPPLLLVPLFFPVNYTFSSPLNDVQEEEMDEDTRLTRGPSVDD